LKKVLLFIIIISSALSLCWSIYRDIQIEKLYTIDLRNRVVGARLQKDGKLPYFYKWNPADGVRYYDPLNNHIEVTSITASPFFHDLLYPIADAPQRSLSRFWLVLQYVFLATIVCVALSMARSFEQKTFIWAIATAFLLTAAWKAHIHSGQLYIFIPFLYAVFYLFLKKSKPAATALVAGLCAISLVLIRPNTIFLFLPFLFLANRFHWRYKILFFIPVVLLLAFSAGNRHQRNLWTQYGQGISKQIKWHQEGNTNLNQDKKEPAFIASWEGWKMEDWDRAQVENQGEALSFNFPDESANFFILGRIVGIKLSANSLLIISLSVISLLMYLFYFVHKKSGFYVYNIAIFGFCLYMVSDLFSPLFRHQYPAVQWLFPLLLAAVGFKKNYKMIYLFIIAGLILMILPNFIPMQHSFGEYIIFASLLLLAFVYNNPLQLKSNHSFLPLLKI
jgi:hypothetical protein